MKFKIWIIIGLVLFAVALGMLGLSKQRADVDIQDAIHGQAPLALLKDATITVPDGDAVVTLVDGAAQYAVAGSSVPAQVILVDDVFAQWGEDGRTDLVTVMAVQPGGSGTFYYLVLFDVDGDTFTKQSEVFLGDRIRVEHVGIGELVHDPDANYRVTVQTLVRKDTEPLAATPTVPETRTFYVTNQQLEEVDVGEDDS